MFSFPKAGTDVSFPISAALVMKMKQIDGSRRAAFLWNILGSGMNAFSTMLLTVVTSRLAGVEDAGVLSLAIGLCYIFFSLATFEVRTYQATDIQQRFSFGEYLGVRILTCGAAAVVCAVYVALCRYDAQKLGIVLAICLFKILESFSDVYQGMFQQREHMERAGQSLFFKVALGCAGYIAVLAATKQTVLAAWVMPAASLAGIAAFDVRVAKTLETRRKPLFSRSSTRALLLECWPLAASLFINMYLQNAAKLQIDRFAPQLQGYWMALFMPAAIINLLGLFAFMPLLTMLRRLWTEGTAAQFVRRCLLICAWLLGMTVLVVAGGSWLGIPVLGWLYAVDLSGYRAVLLVVLVGGGFNSLATFLWNMLIIMRHQKAVLLGDVFSFAFALLAVPVMVNRFGLMGAALSYWFNVLLRSLLFALFALRSVKEKKAACG